MLKRFLEWIGLKKKLDDITSEPPLVTERDLWWVSFGENVGSEINGKSNLFSRPGLIYKKLSSRMGQIDTNDFEKVRKYFKKLYD